MHHVRKELIRFENRMQMVYGMNLRAGIQILNLLEIQLILTVM